MVSVNVSERHTHAKYFAAVQSTSNDDSFAQRAANKAKSDA
jgi:hypothetical protein